MSEMLGKGWLGWLGVAGCTGVAWGLCSRVGETTPELGRMAGGSVEPEGEMGMVPSTKVWRTEGVEQGCERGTVSGCEWRVGVLLLEPARAVPLCLMTPLVLETVPRATTATLPSLHPPCSPAPFPMAPTYSGPLTTPLQPLGPLPMTHNARTTPR